MVDTECRRCGSPMQARGVCPVCEFPHDFGGDATDEAAAEAPAATRLGRLWQSGRLGVAVAALCFAVATLVPLVYVRHAQGLLPRAGVSPLDMLLAQGPYGRYLKSAVLFALPGAALGMVQFLLSRRSRAVMLASRPLVLVVAIIPAIAAALPILKIVKRHRFVHTLGPGAALIALGVMAGVLGALQFGRGVPEPARRRRDDDDDDAD